MLVKTGVFRNARHELDELRPLETLRVDEHLAVSARAARVGLHDAERERDGDRRVDHVAAFRQHLESGRSGDGMRARHSGTAGGRLLVRGMLVQQLVQHRCELVVRLRGDGARAVLRLQRFPLRAPRRRVRRRVVQHGRAIPELIERVRVVRRAIGRGRPLLLDEPQIGRDRRGDRPHAPADRREKIRFAISRAIRIAIVADRGDRFRRRQIDERDRLSVRIPRGLGVPSAGDVDVVTVERRDVDGAARARRRPGESVAGRRPRRALDSRVGQHGAVLPVVHGEHVKFSRRGGDRDVRDARAVGRSRGPSLAPRNPL